MANQRLIINTIYVMGFLDLLGVSMIIPLLSKHYKDIGTSASVMGIISSLYGGIQLFSGPIVGRWSDRSGTRYVMLRCLILSSISYLMLGATHTIVMLLISRLIAGLFKHSQELCKALLADLTPSSQHSAVFGRFNSVSNIGFIFGPLIGGHLSDMNNGFLIMCITAAVLFALDFVLLIFMVPDDFTISGYNMKKNSLFSLRPPPSNMSLLQSLTTMIRTGLWDIFLIRFFLGLAVLMFRSNLALDLDTRYGASGKMIGYLISFSGTVGTAAGFIVGPVAAFYKNDAKLLLHASMLQFVALAGVTLAPNMVAVGLCLTVLGVANSIARVTSLQVTLVRGGQQEKGILMGLGASVLSGSRMLAPLLAGLADDGWLIVGSASMSALMALTGTMFMLTRMRTWYRPDQLYSDSKHT